MYKKQIVAGLAILLIGTVFVGGCKKDTQQKAEAPQISPVPAAPPTPMIQSKTGETLFKQHCAVCHPDGGNIVTPQMTLHRQNLAAHKINKPEDIVKIMRNPGQGMNRFDEATIPDKDAMSIAEFVLNTYK
ncbi:MAG: cytochrome C [Geobacteraceae bacterium GWC2_55_20]|nr:MAG: cytochrome C [Geobacteraceae bacterium GWC2_55_20]OGU20343.1 MAG: cytochrome C [Geobacteraceae bacterium GWF2_54_21]HCE68661.1 cytochrome C [Geobacter sp.]